MHTQRQAAVRRVTDLLRLDVGDRIGGRAGERLLPDERELMQTYVQPRDVVREALAALVEEGLLIRRRGVGTAASGDRFEADARLPPLGDRLERLWGGPLASTPVTWEWVPTPPGVARRLDQAPGDDSCLCIDYVLSLHRVPVGVITNFVRSAEGKSLRQEDFDDFYSMMDRAGAVLSEADFVVEAASADPNSADLMGVPAGAPVLRFDQVIRNAEGQAVDVAVGRFRREWRYGFRSVPRFPDR